MNTLKDLPQALLNLLPTDAEIKIAVTDDSHTRVYLNNEVWVFTNYPTVECISMKEFVIPEFNHSNIESLGCPQGLSKWGDALSEKVTGCQSKLYSLEEINYKTRVKFVLERDATIANRWFHPITIKRGVYDYMIPTPSRVDLSKLFND